MISTNHKKLRTLGASAFLVVCGNLITNTALAYTNQGFIWQGFDHEWRRFVVLPKEGRVPHRISRFSSFIETHPNTSGDNLQGSITFAQSTGVDGNYMRPKGYYSTLRSQDITINNNKTTFSWTDNIEGSEIPIAENSFSRSVSFEIDTSNKGDIEAAAIINGIELNVCCDDEKQPDELSCNSNGLWPYDFYVGFDTCDIEHDETTNKAEITCPLHLRLNRGWTPNQGGFQLPPFFSEIKPLNKKLDIELTVHHAIIHADSEQFSNTRIQPIIATQLLQHSKPITGSQLQPLPAPGGKLITGITGFGFELHEPLLLQQHWILLNSDVRQRGRYIAKLAFSASNPTLDYSQKTAAFKYKMHLWSPITVVDSFVTSRLETTILQFNNSAETKPQQTAKGRLCINSTEQAPAFSKWQECHLNSWWNRWVYGSPQSENTLNIETNW